MALGLTGASGFIGLNVVEQALADGQTVVTFDLQPLPAAACAVFAALPGRLIECTGDITRAADRRRFLTQTPLTALVQAAAITPDAAREARTPGDIIAVNAAAALDCIADAVALNIDRIVAVSSVSAYGTVPGDLTLIDEDTPLRPFNLYGLSKLTLEQGLARLHSLNPFGLTIARLGPQYGRWEWRSGKRDALSALLQCLSAAMTSREAVMPRDVEIDWLYAADAARGLLRLATDRPDQPRVCNIASGTRFSLTHWCQRLAEDFPDFRWRFSDAGDSTIAVNPGFTRAPQAISRMAALGWKPAFDAAAGYADYRAFIVSHPDFAPDRQAPAAAA